MCYLSQYIVKIAFITIQDTEQQETEAQQKEGGHEQPPIPPLPQSHLQALQHRAVERSGSVAKIISQFQEANNVIFYFI